MKETILEILSGKSAHASFERIVAGVPEDKIHEKVGGHSLWELLEHIRLGQKDILEYMKGEYEEKSWPEDYWPSGEGDWDASVEEFLKDREEIIRVLQENDVEDIVPDGEDSHTYLREILLIAIHTSYHLGQMVTIRKELGIWG